MKASNLLTRSIGSFCLMISDISGLELEFREDERPVSDRDSEFVDEELIFARYEGLDEDSVFAVSVEPFSGVEILAPTM